MASFVVIFSLFFAFAAGSQDSYCPRACTREYNPVCGLNAFNVYEIYSNLCILENAICETRTRKILSFNILLLLIFTYRIFQILDKLIFSVALVPINVVLTFVE